MSRGYFRFQPVKNVLVNITQGKRNLTTKYSGPTTSNDSTMVVSSCCTVNTKYSNIVFIFQCYIKISKLKIVLMYMFV